jgi:DNA processing protein
MVYDHPPVLFVRGTLQASDARSVAVVGTRQPSRAGLELATSLARQLAATGITIVSGLAKGIDTAAHAAALNAGGRTVAVFGTTIDQVYPASNKSLARSVSRSGACVSQFLPGHATGPWSFPVRNVTASGLSLGTIVVEAGATSGARLQAQAAVAHGKKVFLVEQLVTGQPWASEMAAAEPLVTVARDADAILEAVDAELGATTELLL